MNVNKYFFRILSLIGFLLILSCLFFKFWNLNVTMGDLKPTLETRVFEKFDTNAFSGNFSKFNDLFARITSYCYYAILVASALNAIIFMGSASISINKRKSFHVLTLILSVGILLLAIAIFVFSVIFVKTNTITQENGFKLKPELLNGVYITVMGGFCAGLFGTYSVVYDTK